MFNRVTLTLSDTSPLFQPFNCILETGTCSSVSKIVLISPAKRKKIRRGYKRLMAIQYVTTRGQYASSLVYLAKFCLSLASSSAKLTNFFCLQMKYFKNIFFIHQTCWCMCTSNVTKILCESYITQLLLRLITIPPQCRQPFIRRVSEDQFSNCLAFFLISPPHTKHG